MEGKLGIRLWGVLNRESPDSINYQIAERLLGSIFQLNDTSSGAVACLCSVSKPSISRFCKDLGYQSYYDFRMDLEKYAISPPTLKKSQNYLHVKETGMVHLYLERCRHYMEELERNINEVELAELVHTMAASSKVYLMGHLQSGSTAKNMQYNLFEMKKQTTAVLELNQQKEVFEHLTGKETILIFSAGGKFFRDYFADGHMPEVPKGVKVYFLTANPEVTEVKGTTVINCRTGFDMAACNLSIDLMANILVLKYKNYVES